MRNGPWITLFLVTTCYFTALMIRGSVMLPYFIYCAGHKMLFSWFNGFGLASLLIGVACSTMLVKRMGKRSVFFWSMLLTGVLCIALYFLPATATVPIIVLEVVRQFAFGCSGPVLWAAAAPPPPSPPPWSLRCGWDWRWAARLPAGCCNTTATSPTPSRPNARWKASA
jgi:Na+/melibiose symporter-like transporter